MAKWSERLRIESVRPLYGVISQHHRFLRRFYRSADSLVREKSALRKGCADKAVRAPVLAIAPHQGIAAKFFQGLFDQVSGCGWLSLFHR